MSEIKLVLFDKKVTIKRDFSKNITNEDIICYRYYSNKKELYRICKIDNFSNNQNSFDENKDNFIYKIENNFYYIINTGELMKKILEKCTKLYNDELNCEEFDEKESCLKCLTSSFYSQNSDTYNCLKKLATYTIEYGSMYVSEIYHFLEESQLFQKHFKEKDKINILSLGCGFKPDYIAVKKYLTNKDIEIKVEYKGHDIEPLWNDIINDIDNLTPIDVKDIIDGFDCNNIDILFMNKVFSTLKNCGTETDFLDTFQDEIDNLKVGSFIIFNDINNRDMGRDTFDTFATENSLEVVGKFFFNREGAYTVNYTSIESSHNICNIPDDISFTPRDAPTKAIFFLYKKV